MTVPFALSHAQLHALQHLHAHHESAANAPDVAAPTDLLVTALVVAGTPPESLHITFDGSVALRFGHHGELSQELNPVDAIALLFRGDLPVLLDLADDVDWDAELVDLTTGDDAVDCHPTPDLRH